MAVNATNQITKGKLVYQKQNEEGEMVQRTKTFSNVVPSVGNDALHAGLSAVAGLIDGTGIEARRVDESTLVNE